MSAPILVLFGLAAPPAMPEAEARVLAEAEQAVVRALSAQGFEVRLSPPGHPRPRTSAASGDVAARVGGHRALSLDYDRSDDAVWVAHYLRGVAEPWAVRRVACRRAGRRPFVCPDLVAEVLLGLRPRRDLDVDLADPLRALAPAVSRCVRRAGPEAPRSVEVDLEVPPSGRVEIRAIAPARVAGAALGACLVQSFEAIDVGPFEGPPIRLTVPIAR